MPAALTGALSRLTSTVRGFSVAQRTIALIGVAVLALGGFALTSWISKPQLTPLFSGLAGDDASAIVDQLQTDNVAYELADGGATILVPQDAVYDERLKAAAAGLPGDTEGGYSLLDTMGMTSSEFQQSVTYKRAIEGELAKTISAMKGVNTASVQLAIPEETVFVSEQADPTASVFIDTQGGALTSEQVQAIVHLTSASIENMKPTDVAVIDSEGSVLSAVGTGVGATDGAGDRQEEVRQSVQAMLDKLVGPGNSTVAVAFDVDEESATRVEETFTKPEGDPALTESTVGGSGSDGSARGGTSSGVLGPDNIAVPDNLDTPEGSTDSTTDAASTDSAGGSGTSSRTNAINKVTETRTIPAGAVARETVSVAVDTDAAKGVDASEVSDLVTAAAGLDRDRGDQVVVKMVSFDTSAAEAASKALAEAEAAESAAGFESLLRTGIIVIGVLGLLVAAIVFFLRRPRRESRESVDLGQLDDILNAPTLPMRFRPEVENPVPGVLAEGFGQPPAPLTPTAEALPADRARSDIHAMADSDPEGTAALLRTLMDDRASV